MISFFILSTLLYLAACTSGDLFGKNLLPYRLKSVGLNSVEGNTCAYQNCIYRFCKTFVAIVSTFTANSLLYPCNTLTAIVNTVSFKSGFSAGNGDSCWRDNQ